MLSRCRSRASSARPSKAGAIWPLTLSVRPKARVAPVDPEAMPAIASRIKKRRESTKTLNSSAGRLSFRLSLCGEVHMSAVRRAIHSCFLILSVTAVVPQAPALADSVPFWGAKASVPIDTPITQLKKGEFLWMAEAVTTGPVVMVVSITEQRSYVYRNGVLIGATTVSTGRPGHQTPTGVFTVLQKQKEHRSTIYDGAPMPYMERLPWGGVALHAGGLPGYPESHGCIHLPTEFAQRLFDISPNGMTVVIGTEATAPEQVAHPGYLAPVKFVGGQPIERHPFAPDEAERWNPELSPSGPISIVLSQASRLIVVYRNGIEIGRARLTVTGDAPLVNHAL